MLVMPSAAIPQPLTWPDPNMLSSDAPRYRDKNQSDVEIINLKHKIKA